MDGTAVENNVNEHQNYCWKHIDDSTTVQVDRSGKLFLTMACHCRFKKRKRKRTQKTAKNRERLHTERQTKEREVGEWEKDMVEAEKNSDEINLIKSSVDLKRK
ncbi:hypothetical protein CBL_12748 [Carabus blaptoides fortunei]